METIEYTTVGQHDFFEKVEIDLEGHFSVDGSSYGAKSPRSGTLDENRQKTLRYLVDHLPAKFNNVQGDRTFAAQLVIITKQGKREFWIRPFAQAPKEIDQLVSFIRDL